MRTMHVRILAVAGLVAFGIAAYGLLGRVDPTEPAGRRPGAAEEPRAMLRGRIDPAAPTGAAPALAALILQATSGTEDVRHTAIRELQRRFVAGEIPLAELVPLALLPSGKDGNGELSGWARATLAEKRPASLALLPEILRGGLGASAEQQDAVAWTLRSLEQVRPTDVPLVIALFQSEQTGHWLKRALVDSMEDLGTAALPVAPHLVDHLLAVYRERARAMQEDFMASIHTHHDTVEYDVQRLLASMGEDAVPLLAERLTAFAERPRHPAPEGAWLARYYDDAPLGILAGALAEAGLDGQRALATLLAHDDPDLRAAAAAALDSGALDPDLFLAPLEAALGDPDPTVRTRALRALEHCGPRATPLLLAALEDAAPGVREAAAHVLARIGVDAQHGLPPLLEVLGDENEFTALDGARSIATYGEAAVPALDALIGHLQTDDPWFRSRFAVPVGTVARHAPDSLARAWEAGDAELRVGLIQVIAEDEEPPVTWLELLEQGLEDPDLAVRVHAAVQLAESGRNDVLAPLVAGFRSQDGRLRATATGALRHIGPGAAHLLPDVIERLEQQEGLWTSSGPGGFEQSEEQALSSAVRGLGPSDLPRMFPLLVHEEFHLWYAAQGAFEEAGGDGIAFFEGAWDTATTAQRVKILDVASGAFYRKADVDLQPAIRHLAHRGLADPNARVRLQAAQSLEHDASSRDACLDVLAALLAESDRHTVSMAAYWITRHGAHAARIEATLRDHADHSDDEVRGYVRTALEHIQDAR